MRTFEVEVTNHHAGLEFRVGKFKPCTTMYADNRFSFTVSSEAERSAVIRACEFIAETLKREG